MLAIGHEFWRVGRRVGTVGHVGLLLLLSLKACNSAGAHRRSCGVEEIVSVHGHAVVKMAAEQLSVEAVPGLRLCPFDEMKLDAGARVQLRSDSGAMTLVLGPSITRFQAYPARENGLQR